VRSGSEIESALRAFVGKWHGYSDSEAAGAQTFLNELFAAYGSDRMDVGAHFEDFKTSAGFMDLHWPGILIVEMKKPGLPLSKAENQRKRYWEESSEDTEGVPLPQPNPNVGWTRHPPSLCQYSLLGPP